MYVLKTFSIKVDFKFFKIDETNIFDLTQLVLGAYVSKQLSSPSMNGYTDSIVVMGT